MEDRSSSYGVLIEQGWGSVVDIVSPDSYLGGLMYSLHSMYVHHRKVKRFRIRLREAPFFPFPVCSPSSNALPGGPHIPAASTGLRVGDCLAIHTYVHADTHCLVPDAFHVMMTRVLSLPASFPRTSRKKQNGHWKDPSGSKDEKKKYRYEEYLKEKVEKTKHCCCEKYPKSKKKKARYGGIIRRSPSPFPCGRYAVVIRCCRVRGRCVGRRLCPPGQNACLHSSVPRSFSPLSFPSSSVPRSSSPLSSPSSSVPRSFSPLSSPSSSVPRSSSPLSPHSSSPLPSPSPFTGAPTS